jgi:sugar O-acyltransferase (sialic acid O-acetyltransferase NeuD family)
VKPRIALFGGGLHAQYCIDIIEKQGKYEVAGIIDPNIPSGEEIYGTKILGTDKDLIPLMKEHKFSAGLITIGDNWVRAKIHQLIIDIVPDFEFVSAIHPSLIRGNNVKIGEGVIIMAGCIINTGAIVSDFCFFATGAQLEHDCFMGEYSSISAGSVTGGEVKIGKYSAITLGVTIVDKVHIGENSVIGSGSLIMKDVPDNVLVYGNPAKIIRERQRGDRYLKPRSEKSY